MNATTRTSLQSTPSGLADLANLMFTQRAVLVWGAIVAIALMSFYVHVLNEQVSRGDKLRAEMKSPRGAGTNTWGAGARAYASTQDTLQGAQAMPASLRRIAVDGLSLQGAPR